MTDPFLVYRAEQALLGALLARQGDPDAAAVITASGGLRPQDFAGPRHQAICAALTGDGLTRPGGLAGLAVRLRDFFARLLGRQQARELAAYTAGLPGWCPDPTNLASYAAMVTSAARDRAAQDRVRDAELAAWEDPRLASAAAWLDSTAAATRGRGPRRNPATAPAVAPATAPAAARAAAALPPVQAAPAPAGSPAPATGAGPASTDPGPLPTEAARLARLLRPAVRPQARGRQAAAPAVGLTGVLAGGQVPASRDDLQDQVLAGLMRHPGQAREVTAWLPATVFTPGPRREVYELIRLRAVGGSPVDPLIIAWEASQAGSAVPAGQAPPPAESPAVAALRIGRLDPAPGTAGILARALYADHVCTQTFGPGWERAPRPAQSAVPVPVPGPAGPAPDPGQPARQPEPAAAAGKAGTQPAPARPARPAPASPAGLARPARPAQPPLMPPGQPPAPLPAGPAQRM